MLVKEQIKRLTYLSLYALYSRFKLFIVPVCIVPVVVFLLSATAQKQYVTHATILIEESSLLNPFLDDLSFSFELSNRIDALRTLVISRKVLIAVAQETQLIADNASNKEIEKIHQQLASALSLSLVGDELVRIHLKWHEPDKMKLILEKVVEKFIERLLAPTKASLDTSEQFFYKQLDTLREELEHSEDELAKFKVKYSDTLPEVLNSNRQTLDRLLSDKQNKFIELSGAKAKLNNLSNKMAQANPVLGNLEEKIIRLGSELSLLKTRYTDKHSKVIEKSRELESLLNRQKVLLSRGDELQKVDIERLWQMANTMPISQNGENSVLVSQIVALEEAKNNVEQLQQEFNMLDGQVKGLGQRLLVTSDIEKQLSKLQRDYDVKQALYKEMLGRYEMAKVTGKLVKYEGPDKVKTIERAYSPTQPINTSLALSLVLGIVLGLFSGVASVFIATLCDSHLKDIATIEKLSSGAVLTVLPIIKESSILSAHRIAEHRQNRGN
ncbi:GumC family protein [Pseudoalteromonas sp. S16_S37]|uniref:GumC family protein n=1 Tax=Pseudoalteromonas sp. S16_S37 TaxID=2720228 RepID=UPI0016815342|nr:GNVR domain-containing protein [Pseudoalteromonas sp. S16_S37]MBD1582149.1 sugar transporter [Pseudoalteromonas sp. S16_S37]